MSGGASAGSAPGHPDEYPGVYSGGRAAPSITGRNGGILPVILIAARIGIRYTVLQRPAGEEDSLDKVRG